MTPDELLAHLDAPGLSKFDMPEYFLRLDEIPLTPNGKMLKRAIVDWIKDGRVTPQPVRFDGKRSRDAANAQLTRIAACPYERATGDR